MIITKLIGGLGNQLFQYAVARCLALKRNTELKIDMSSFKEYTLRRYSLSHFNIIENIASEAEINLLKTETATFLERLTSKVLRKPFLFQSDICERYHHYDPEIMKLPNNSYLDGYWQSEKYFQAIADIIRSDFTIKKEPDAINKEYAEKITSSTSVSIHIRRGDYVENPSASRIHGTCDLGYYCRSLEYISSQITSPHFFIFSDDPEWASSNLIIPYLSTYVTHNDALNYVEDFRLMRLCKHHIIANSSFSWWGAWLCNNKDKIVIAPNKWFNVASRNTKDLIPDPWIRI